MSAARQVISLYKVVISGFYGFDNAGDEAILQSMVSELRKAFSDIDIVVLSENPSKTAKEHNVRSVDRTNMLKICSAINKCDVVISGGGSIFQDVTSTFSMWYYSGILLFALMLKKPVVAFAQGIGPIRNKFNRKLLSYIMNRAYSVSVRDTRSQHELKNLGVRKDILCTVDPAFLLNVPDYRDSLRVLQEEANNKELVRPRVGFSIRSWKDNVDVSSIFAQVADKVSSELGVDIVFIPLHYKKDIVLAEEIAAKMKGEAIIIRKSCSPQELIGIYGLMELNISIRFHGLVFSIMNGIPMVPVSYDPKIDSLMELLGMDHIIRYKELDVDKVFMSVKKIWDNRAEAAEKIKNKNLEFRKSALKGVNQLTESIEYIKGLRKNKP